MGYYDLAKKTRQEFYHLTAQEIQKAVSIMDIPVIEKYASDADTYIRKNCYLVLGRLYKKETGLRESLLLIIDKMSLSENEKVRQTVVYALGEIGKNDFSAVQKSFTYFLEDRHHIVKNALTGALKQLADKSPGPVLQWTEKILGKVNDEMKKKLVHGLELRGRKYPEDILPLLVGVNYKDDKGLRKMLIHIIGQISYKQGCLPKVVKALNSWQDNEFVLDCKEEINKVHQRYEKFCFIKPTEAEKYLSENLNC